MGLLSIIRKIKQKEKELRILILGLDNAGKTTCVKKFNGEDVNSISPTLGFDIKTLEYNGMSLTFWDVGGQKSLRSFWRNYFEQTEGIIWVVDSADRRRLEDCKLELDKLLQEEKLAGATLCIFANKQDLPGACTKEEISQILGFERISQSRHCLIVSVSAVTGEGLADGIQWLVKDISSRVFLLE
eukprot:TRINITY_DN10511_c0_g1_i1.p1 TRINITY_DN10511_c0_g1~~TRINITY_DN10511_c0_g1_i1.p1  ORF type:complete len:186 (-),score=35.29 TRINITY_DN10511_c0_g1_i1:254-811(-)